MTESLLLSIKVVTPLVVFIGLGYLIRCRNWISQVSIKEMNQVVFKVLLSTMVFYNIYQSDIVRDFDPGLLIYAVSALFVIFLILCVLTGRRIEDKSIAPVVIQGIYRSNFVLFGLQVSASVCGSDQVGMTTILIAVIIPVYNVLAVFLFETYRHEHIDIKKIFKGILTNPLILASALGLLSVAVKVRFGTVVEDTLKSISQMATPLSLILLGGTISLEGFRKYWRYAMICAAGRLVIVPMIILTIAVCLGYRGSGLVALMVMSGSPTAVSSFPMAAQMGGNSELAGQIVAVTTVFSTITIFMWTYVLSFTGLI